MANNEEAADIQDSAFLTGEEAAQRLLDLLGPELGRVAAIGLGALDSSLLREGIDPATMKRIGEEEA